MGGKTQAELSDEIEKKINTLNELITKAKDKILMQKEKKALSGLLMNLLNMQIGMKITLQ